MGFLFDGKYSQCGNRFLPITEVCLEPSPKFTMKSSIVNDRMGSKYTSALAYCQSTENVKKPDAQRIFSVKVRDKNCYRVMLPQQTRNPKG